MNDRRSQPAASMEKAALMTKRRSQQSALDELRREVEALRADRERMAAALTDALEFIEYYSRAWNGVSAKHPNTIATNARDALAATASLATSREAEAVASIPDLAGLVRYLRLEAAMEDMIDDRRDWLLKWADSLSALETR